MNWNWACEQLLKGKKVTRKDWATGTHIYRDKSRYIYWCTIYKSILDYRLSIDDIQATDWGLYEEPKKWTEEEQKIANALILLGYKTIWRDGEEEIVVWKDNAYMFNREITLKQLGIEPEFFKNIKVEDGRIDLMDIVDSEVK